MLAALVCTLVLSSRRAGIIEVCIPQSEVTFSIRCSDKVAFEKREPYYSGFFLATQTWKRVAPLKAHFKVQANPATDFTVFIGPNQINFGPSVVGEIYVDRLIPRVQGRIYITSAWNSSSVIKAISLHELGHLLGLADSYGVVKGKWTNGWGVMGALDIDHLQDEPAPEEIQAVNEHK